MLKQSMVWCAVVVVGLWAAASDAWGQVGAADAQAVAEASGIGQVRKLPTALRAHSMMVVQGASMEDALTRLKQRQGEIKTELVKLGAVETGVLFGPTRVVQAVPNARADMARMITERMAHTQPAAQPQNAAPVTLVGQVQAEWMLEAKDTEGVLMASQQIQNSLINAGLFKPQMIASATREEEELEEEGQGPGKANERPITFIFIARISDADLATATAEAFAAARNEADRLATAAGVKLGRLRRLSSAHGATGAMEASEGSDYEETYRMRMLLSGLREARMQAGQNASDTREVVGMQAGLLKYNVQVQVAFTIDEK